MKQRLKALLPVLILAVLLSACLAVNPGGEVTIPSSSVSTPVSSKTTQSTGTTTTSSVVPTTTSGNIPPVVDPPVMSHTCPDIDPYANVDKTAFYADYSPACCLKNALFRSQHGLLSGSTEVPGQYAIDAAYRPKEGSLYIRNTSARYEDGGSTYIITDAAGKEVMRIYKGGAYITLEEVAAYMYAFGGSSASIPANYTSSKKTRPTASIWGEYLRVNHSKFSGSTVKYPYEPELPDISGCGGTLQYYEMDIGTTGTVTPGYDAKPYNNGIVVNRGAARIVYARQDKNFNGIYEPDEVYVFYTDNHYNDFREYLNYYGGWGEIFGNVTGGGAYSSKTNCNPTPYVRTAYKDLSAAA